MDDRRIPISASRHGKDGIVLHRTAMRSGAKGWIGRTTWEQGPREKEYRVAIQNKEEREGGFRLEGVDRRWV